MIRLRLPGLLLLSVTLLLVLPTACEKRKAEEASEVGPAGPAGKKLEGTPTIGAAPRADSGLADMDAGR